MTESRLSYKIALCAYLENIDENKQKKLQATKWMNDELGHSNNDNDKLTVPFLVKSNEVFTNNALKML